jgi:SAM-dependent methyltransferase
MNILEKAQSANFHRRVNVLAKSIAEFLPDSATVLDIGCGDGLIDKLILDLRPNITIEGCDVQVRNFIHMPVLEFKGTELPFESKSFDFTLFIDVLHHTSDPSILLAEAKRVSRQGIIVKDHLTNKIFAIPILRLMDRAGNSRYNVNLPYNYWPENKWLNELARLDLNIRSWSTNIPIYPWWASWLFGSGLHFIASLDIRG